MIPAADSAFLKEILDSLDLSVAVYDPDLRFVLANRAYYSTFPKVPSDGSRRGWTFEAMLRATIAVDPARTALGSPDEIDAFVAERVAEMRSTEPLRREYQAENGRCDILQRIVTPSGYRVSTRYDITEQKELERQLRVALAAVEGTSRAKSSFLGSMSHELRTPLNGILGYAEILRGAMLGGTIDPQYREAAGNILEAGNHLLSLISDLLDLARIDAGKVDLAESDVDLDEAIGAVVRVMSARAGGGLLKVLPWSGFQLRADARMVRQMLLNLIGNAIKYAPGAPIEISVEAAPDGGLDLVVTDHGPGLPDGIRHHIGEAFVPGADGTGLGLALVGGMAHDHGGRLLFDEVPGGGTRAVIRFPAERRLPSVVPNG
jgi:signal transduction histidine kinase